MATKYGIISKGHIIKEITARQLQAEVAKTTDILADNPEALYKLLGELLPTETVTYIPGGARFVGEADLNMVLSAVINAGIRIISINCHESSFEDYYMETIGGKRV